MLTVMTTGADDNRDAGMTIEHSGNGNGSSSNISGQIHNDTIHNNGIDDLIKGSKAILASVADTTQFKYELAVVQELLEKNAVLTGMIGSLQAQGSSGAIANDENVYMASLYINELQANLCEVDRLYSEMGLREKK